MARYRTGVAAAALAVGMASCVEAQRFDWNDVGQTFCRAAVAEDLSGMEQILSPSLRQLIERAAQQAEVRPRLLLQAYDAPASGCSVRTRNAAIVEVRRESPGGPGWTDYLVMVPEVDGTTRIDDILFATRRSDTLRARLRLVVGR
jgi:hypothetical protein